MSDMPRIHALPLHLANQIAAGEVIERPASVVKELVENSLDAGADQIFIEIEGAGNKLIRVRDNGLGIHPEDLPLALSRHATSKLHSSEQLSHIASLGFRGEALPSISSVSRLTLISRQADSDCAWQLSGDQNNAISPAAHPQGTTLEIRDLFFNLPARRHFLRSNKTEQNHILTTLQRLALSQFAVGFQCQLSASISLKLPAAITLAQQQQRIAKICGKNFINNSLFIEQDYDDIKLEGWLGKADAHRPQTDVQYFFINGRVIRDRVITHAIRQAYSDKIPAGRQPAYVLYLTIPLDRVDINVHPTKHEVRFRDARLIHGLLTSALQQALTDETVLEPMTEPLSAQASQNIRSISRASNQASKQPQIAEHASDYQLPIVTQSRFKESISAKFGQAITLIEQRYVITKSSQDSLLIDLQQAEQQLRRQQLQNAINSNTLSARPILVPISLSVDNHLIALASQYERLLESVGVRLQPQPSALLIRSIPSLLAQTDLKVLVLSLLTALSNNQTDKASLAIILQQHLPLITISQLEQATQLLLQLNECSLEAPWCRRLDQQTLNSLF
ncbi:MAG: DNA mismatch repair endonuclease MutL [Pseudomonadota bacterium]|nr:DNA mismatch repair endonuclease MutL [Pseudomonadota bacterium]MDO7711123.1 DNA mismatch repair endonuclease MutL [Pseudomonadota bacterium]